MIVKEVEITIKRTVPTGDYANVSYSTRVLVEFQAGDTERMDEIMRAVWDTGNRNIRVQMAPFVKGQRAQVEGIILGLPEEFQAQLLAQLEGTDAD